MIKGEIGPAGSVKWRRQTRGEMEALKFYVKIGEKGKIELPELVELKGRRAEIIIFPHRYGMRYKLKQRLSK